MPVSLLFAFLGGCNTIEPPLGVKAPGAMVEPTWAADGGSVAQQAACVNRRRLFCLGHTVPGCPAGFILKEGFSCLRHHSSKPH
jgi:hypothetical protein